MNLTLPEDCDVRGVIYGAAVARDAPMNGGLIEDPFALYAAGKIRPAISRRFPDREAPGEVVVTMD